MIDFRGNVLAYVVLVSCILNLSCATSNESTITITSPFSSGYNSTARFLNSTPFSAEFARPFRRASQKLHYSNISSIYNKIIKTYDRKFRPFYSEKPVNVEIDCHVLTFGDINEVEMEYSLDIYFLQIWFDPRFNLSKPKYENATIELIGTQVQDVWLPDTIFINSKKSKFHAITIDNRFLTIYLISGMMAYHSRITMTAACRMDLRKYPFDVQSCSLAIESYGHGESDIKYIWRKQQGCVTACYDVYIYDRDMANFDIKKAEKSKDKTTYHAPSFSSATAKFVFKRRQEYFIFRIFIPSILIVMVSWSTFWISQDAVPARAGICITTILTLITMLGVVNTNMPKVSYIKAIDLFLLVSFIFVFSSLVEYICVLNFRNYLFKSDKKCKKKAKEIDNRHVVKDTGSCVISVKSEEKQQEPGSPDHFSINNGCKFRQRKGYSDTSSHLLGDNANKKVKKLNLQDLKIPPKKSPTHIVDKLARVIFPLSYFLFNFAYWWIALNSEERTSM